MDDHDRNPSSGSSGRYSRRRPTDDERRDDQQVRRRPRPEEFDDTAPTRSEERRYRSDRERARTSREPTSQSPRESGRYRPTSREERPTRNWSTDRFRRAGRETIDDVDDRSYGATRDPYDRLRRVGNRAPRRVEVESYDEPGFDDYLGDEFDDADPGIDRRRPGRSRARGAASGLRQQQIRQVGALVANPAPELRPIVVGALISLGSIGLLSILLLIQGGDLSAWFPMRWDAEGEATVFGKPATAWRLPVFALFSTIIALGLGWWLREREPFAAQFLAVGVLLIHGLIWVSAITLLW